MMSQKATRRIVFTLIISILAGACISFLLLLSEKRTGPFWPVRVMISYAAIAIAIACLTYCFFSGRIRTIPLTKRQRISLGIIAVLFGALQVFGRNVAYLEKLVPSAGIRYGLLLGLSVVGWAAVFYEASFLLFRLYQSVNKGPTIKLSRKGFGFICFFGILVFWSVWILAYYPATVDFDTEAQLCTYLGIWPRSNHHPWFSSVAVGLCYRMGKSIGNDNLGMFLYVAIRAIIMAMIYTRCLLLLKDEKINKYLVVLVLLFYAITPVWGAYAKQPFKDTLAAALFCLYITYTVLLMKGITSDEPMRRQYLFYTLTGLAASLFRHNFFYVFLPTTLLLIIFLFRHKTGLLRISLTVVGILVYGILQFLMTHCWGIKPINTLEALAVPMQQTARTVKQYGDSLDEEDKQGIGSVLDIKKAAEAYDPVIYDPVRDAVKKNLSGDDYRTYFTTWFRMLWKHPVSYVEATIANTYGYYTFTADGYPSGGLGNCGMVILDKINRDQNYHFDELFDFHYLDRLQGLRSFLEKGYRLWHKIPILNLTDCIPFYSWLFVSMGCYIIFIHSRGSRLIPCFAVLLAILSCIASPDNGCFRYFAPCAVAMPALIPLLKNANQQEEIHGTDDSDAMPE